MECDAVRAPRMLLWTAALLGWGLVTSASGQEPWDQGAFQGDPAAMLERLRELGSPEEDDAEILLDQAFFKVLPDRRVERREHRIFRVVTEAAAREWALVESEYAPWYQNPPVIRARVIRRNGQVIELDPSTVTEAAVEQADSQILSDQRIIRAVLPGLSAGCIAEFEVTTTESQPYFKAGSVDQFGILTVFPLRHARVTIESPAGLPLQHAIRGLDIEPQVSEMSGGKRIVYDVSDPPRLLSFDPHLPPDVPLLPAVSFSTGASWQAVAKVYAEMVEQRVQAADLQELVDRTLDGTETRDEAIRKLKAKVHDLVRYTGLEFGQAAIFPYSIEEVLRRHYGDCKDQATLLVAMLRTAGYPAHVALLRSGQRLAVVPELPGLGAFDHAIVYVGGDEPVWIDPTDPFTPGGQLPLDDQGRWSLVASPETTELIRTPRAPSSDNVYSKTYRIHLEGNGTRVAEDVVYRGTLASDARAAWADIPPDRRLRQFRDYALSTYETDQIVKHEVSDPFDVHQPLAVSFECAQAQWAAVDAVEAYLTIDPGSVFRSLPYYLTTADEEGEASDDDDPRTLPYHFDDLHVTEIRYEIHPPAGYRLSELPENREVRYGPVTFSQKYANDGGVVTAEFRLDTGNGVLTPEQVTELGDHILGLAPGDPSVWMISLHWQHEALQLYLEGKSSEAIQLYNKLLREDPQFPHHVSGYIDVLVNAGLADAAQRVAREATRRDAQDGSAWGKLGSAYMYDPVGRETRSGYDRDAALAAFKKCIELDPENFDARWNYAIVLEFDTHGNRYPPGENLKQAVELYRGLIEDGYEPDVTPINLALNLLHQRRLDELWELTEQQMLLAPDLTVAARAAQEDVASAMLVLQQMTRDNQQQVQIIAQAAQHLNAARFYDRTVELYKQLEQLGIPAFQLAQASELLGKMRRHEQMVRPGKPIYPIQKLATEAICYGLYRERMQPFLANNPSHLPLLEQWAIDTAQLRQQSRESGSSYERRLDSISMTQYDVEGDDETGYRIRVSDDMFTTGTLYVVKVEEGYRCWAPGVQQSEVGKYALAALKQGKPEVAVQWLEWARLELEPGPLLNPFSGSPFMRLWPGADLEDPQDLRELAAALVSAGDVDGEVVAILEKAVAAESSDYRKLQFQRALLNAYRGTEKWPAMEKLATQMLEVFQAEEIQLRRGEALLAAGRKQDAQAHAEAWQKRSPGSAAAVKYAMRAHLLAGDPEQAYDQLTAYDTQNEDNFVDRLEIRYFLAALGMQLGKDPVLVENFINQAVSETGRQGSTILQMLAAVQADQGKLTEARDSLREALELRARDQVEPHDYFVVGRIAEHVGLVDDAVAAYTKAAEHEGEFHPLSLLAKQRLETLKGE